MRFSEVQSKLRFILFVQWLQGGRPLTVAESAAFPPARHVIFIQRIDFTTRSRNAPSHTRDTIVIMRNYIYRAVRVGLNGEQTRAPPMAWHYQPGVHLALALSRQLSECIIIKLRGRFQWIIFVESRFRNKAATLLYMVEFPLRELRGWCKCIALTTFTTAGASALTLSGAHRHMRQFTEITIGSGEIGLAINPFSGLQGPILLRRIFFWLTQWKIKSSMIFI